MTGDPRAVEFVRFWHGPRHEDLPPTLTNESLQ